MYIIIEFYIIFSLMLLVFNLIFIFTKNSRLRRLNPLKNQARETLAVEFERYRVQEGLSPAAVHFLEHKLGTTRNLLILEKEMTKRRPYRAELKEAIKPYVFKQMSHYQKKNAKEKAYYAYFLTLFEYEEGEAAEQNDNQLFAFLDSESFHVFANTMDAIYQFGSPYLIIAAIKKVDERGGFYHRKLLTDGLLTVNHSVETLKELMINDFYKLEPATQVSLLNYFRLKELSVNDFALDILKAKEVNEEVFYATMRYFIRYPHPQAKEIFIAILKNEKSYWVEEMLAIQSLKYYDDPTVRQVIKEKVTSCQWEVRSNAISYLYQHGLTHKEFTKILGLNDRYMTEQLYYYYEEDQNYAAQILEKLAEMDEEKNKTQNVTTMKGEQE